jgi:hypothetical protein
MSHELTGLNKLGGGALIASGVLFLSRYLLDLMAGSPPSNGAEILAWVSSAEGVLATANEVLFFAALCMVPAVIALYHSLAGTDRAKAASGCGIIAVVIPVLAVLDIVHGRLVYPVYGMRITTPAIAEFAVAIFYGGMHATSILLGVATIVLSLAMTRGVYGKPVAYLGMTTGVLDVVASYPWAIGTLLMIVCQVFFAAWFVAVGSKLYRM